MAKKVNVQELSRRYTTAVFELAKSGKKLDVVSADLEKTSQYLKEQTKLSKLLNSPLLSASKQVDIMKEVASSLKLSPLTTNLLLIVARNRRVQYLEQIINAFRAQIAEEQGFINAEVTSAEKLSDAQTKEISAAIASKTGKKVHLAEKVDSGIIGGLIVKMGSKMIDYSVRARLNKLKNQMKNVG